MPFGPLQHPMTVRDRVGIRPAGPVYGWPVAAGGSQSITCGLLASVLGELGGTVESGHPGAGTLAQLPVRL